MEARVAEHRRCRRLVPVIRVRVSSAVGYTTDSRLQLQTRGSIRTPKACWASGSKASLLKPETFARPGPAQPNVVTFSCAQTLYDAVSSFPHSLCLPNKLPSLSLIQLFCSHSQVSLSHQTLERSPHTKKWRSGTSYPYPAAPPPAPSDPSPPPPPSPLPPHQNRSPPLRHRTP